MCAGTCYITYLISIGVLSSHHLLPITLHAQYRFIITRSIKEISADSLLHVHKITDPDSGCRADPRTWIFAFTKHGHVRCLLLRLNHHGFCRYSSSSFYNGMIGLELAWNFRLHRLTWMSATYWPSPSARDHMGTPRTDHTSLQFL